MQLRSARLCLDCDEVHDAQQCPACASESFAYITRWVPAPERRERPRPLAPPPEAAAYRELLEPDRKRPGAMSVLKGGAAGLAALGIVRWLWRQSRPPKPPTEDP